MKFEIEGGGQGSQSSKGGAKLSGLLFAIVFGGLGGGLVYFTSGPPAIFGIAMIALATIYGIGCLLAK